MRIAVTGSTGLVGSALCRSLQEHGHEVVPFVRSRTAPGQVLWDPVAGSFDSQELGVIEAVVHLAGAGIGERRWTEARRAILVDSRVRSTRLLVEKLAALDSSPAVLLSASAVGFYGDCGDEIIDEATGPGEGFLADLCQQWEQAANAGADVGMRVVNLRSGIVLSGSGGALARQLPLMRAGLGGRLSHGRQWTSWISIDDEVSAIEHLLGRSDLSGPVNLTSPNPVTNREFTQCLARTVHRPAVLSVPAPALRLVLGRGLTDEALLASQRVIPRVLDASGFAFSHSALPDALRSAVQTKRNR